MELVVGSVVPVLEAMALVDETRAALALLRSAVADEAIPLTVLRQAREALRRVVSDPARTAFVAT